MIKHPVPHFRLKEDTGVHPNWGNNSESRLSDSHWMIRIKSSDVSLSGLCHANLFCSSKGWTLWIRNGTDITPVAMFISAKILLSDTKPPDEPSKCSVSGLCRLLHLLYYGQNLMRIMWNANRALLVTHFNTVIKLLPSIVRSLAFNQRNCSPS